VSREQALRDARLAGQAALHSLAVQQQYAQGGLSREQFERQTAQDSATVEGLRRPYVGTSAETVFDAELSRIANAALPGRQAAPPQAAASSVWDWTNISIVIFIALILVLLYNYKAPATALSKNFGSASYAPQETGIPTPYYAMQGVFFGKSSHPEVPSGELSANPGAPICSTPEHHTLIVARTRTGKGTRVIIPTLLRYVGSVMTIDPKGENAAITARTRAGFTTVHIINPWRELEGTFKGLGVTPATYNPLDVLDRNDDGAVATAQAMANAICPVPPGAKDSFWQGSASSVMTAVLLWLTDQPGETKTLARAREIITLTRKKLKEDYLIKMAASGAFDGAIRENAAPFIDMAEDTYSGVMTSLAEATKFLSDPLVKKATATSTFSMADLIREPTSVYLVIPPDKIDTQRTWLRLVIAAAMHTYKRAPLENRPAHRCMFLIDEFPALGRLPDLPRDIATMSGYGVDFTLIIQGIDQLKDHYGDAQGTILSNCAYKWFCNVNDLDSARYLSDTLGKATVQTIGHSLSENTGKEGTAMTHGETTNFGEVGRPLLMPDEVLNLGRDTAILLHPNSHPHYLRPVDYWNLATGFTHLKSSYPHLYWDPPLAPDPNPYYKHSLAKS
jgi:type IV secretory pathway TraG/TraD family ATPase VirD4